MNWPDLLAAVGFDVVYLLVEIWVEHRRERIRQTDIRMGGDWWRR